MPHKARLAAQRPCRKSERSSSSGGSSVLSDVELMLGQGDELVVVTIGSQLLSMRLVRTKVTVSSDYLVSESGLLESGSRSGARKDVKSSTSSAQARAQRVPILKSATPRRPPSSSMMVERSRPDLPVSSLIESPLDSLILRT